jgi:hypothetical protein
MSMLVQRDIRKRFSSLIHQDNRYIPFLSILLLTLLSSVVVVIYYLNYPEVDINADTPAYLGVVERFLAHPDLLVDTGRLPGYPLFVSLIYTLAGHGNLLAVSDVQAVLFIITALEIYFLALLIFQRTWLAFLVGLLVGTNIILIAYIKPIMTEGLSAFFLTSLTLAVVYFIRRVTIQSLWVVTICSILLVFTRPEWVYLPALLFAYLLLGAVRHGKRGRQLIRYAAAATLSLLLIYTLVGAYIVRNGIQNHYQGFTGITNFNEMGKVLQYGMQDETSPQERSISRTLDTCITRLGTDPYHVLPCVPALKDKNDNYESAAGEFAEAIILHHPVEFLLKSFPIFFTSLFDYYYVTYHTNVPLFPVLAWLKALDHVLYWLNILFPLCAVAWIFFLCWRPTAARQDVLAMGAITLFIIYGIVVTTLGGYRPDDYMRVHIVFDSLLLLMIWGSLFRMVPHLPKLVLSRFQKSVSDSDHESDVTDSVHNHSEPFHPDK